MKTALITGITGQDGYYLAKLLIEKGYEVHGMIRRTSLPSTGRLNTILDKITLHTGDMTCSSSIRTIIEKVQPEEIYNLAAQSHVGESFKTPLSTWDITAAGVLRILDAVRDLSLTGTKIYQACTSEMFGNESSTGAFIQDETTRMSPRSPYAVAKVAAYNTCVLYRKGIQDADILWNPVQSRVTMPG